MPESASRPRSQPPLPSSLGQLIYTSFAGVGFQLLKSAGVPDEVQQAFLKQIVYEHWDSYAPPPSGYRAAYLQQLQPDRTLFGWVYNDGVDDLGRDHVPYFVCYYYPGPLRPWQLDAIWQCLDNGPGELPGRHELPAELARVTLPVSDYNSSAYPGVSISPTERQRQEQALEASKLLSVFVPQTPIAGLLQPLTSSSLLGATSGGLRIAPPAASVEEYAQMLLNKAQEQSRSRPRGFGLLGRKASIAPAALALPEAAPSRIRRRPLLGGNLPLGRVLLGLLMLIPLVAASLLSLEMVRPLLSPPAAVVPKTQTQIPNTPLDSQEAVWVVALSHDGQHLFSAGTGNTIKIWDRATGKVLQTLGSHRQPVRTLAVSPDGQTLVSGSSDGTIKLWDLPTGKLRQSLQTSDLKGPLDIGLTITIGGKPLIDINPEPAQTAPVPVWSLAISPDGKTLASGDASGRVALWDLARGTQLRNLKGHEGRVFSLAFSPDGQTLVGGGEDQTIQLWRVDSGDRLQTLVGHNNAVRSVTFSPDGKTIASGSWDQTVKLWNLESGQLLRTLTGHAGRVVAVAFSADGHTLFSSSKDRTIKVWNPRTWELQQTLPEQSDWALALATQGNWLESW